MSHARIPAVVHPTTQNLYWAAGFLEGEGCFIDSRSARVSANQVNPEPVQRLQAYFGGSLKQFTAARARANHSRPIWNWACNGSQGAAVAMTLYPLLSAVRQEAIRKMLTLWRARNGRGQFARARWLERTHCKAGHLYTPETMKLVTYTKNGKTGTMRRCLICFKAFYDRHNASRKEYQKERYQRRKLKS